MHINRKQLLKIFMFIIVFIVAILLLSFVREELRKRAMVYLGKNDVFAKNVPDDNQLKIVFKEKFPDRNIILACEEDITGDSIKDLIVISSVDELIETIAIVDRGNNDYIFTEPIAAPRENQMIKFFNMDKDNIIEVLITGEKKGQVGYAIYRYEDGRLRDIFGEGMEDCC